MKFYRLLTFAALVIGMGMLSGCEGPVGPAGENGAPGSKGDKGDKGDPGTANVIYSDWKLVTTNLWTKTTVNGVVKFYHDIAAPALDQALLDRGQVLVYVKLSQDNGQVRALPYSVRSSLTEVQLEYSFSQQKVRIWSVDPDQGRNLTPPDGEYRYILIPGSQRGRLNGGAPAYADAAAWFGIRD